MTYVAWYKGGGGVSEKKFTDSSTADVLSQVAAYKENNVGINSNNLFWSNDSGATFNSTNGIVPTSLATTTTPSPIEDAYKQGKGTLEQMPVAGSTPTSQYTVPAGYKIDPAYKSMLQKVLGFAPTDAMVYAAQVNKLDENSIDYFKQVMNNAYSVIGKTPTPEEWEAQLYRGAGNLTPDSGASGAWNDKLMTWAYSKAGTETPDKPGSITDFSKLPKELTESEEWKALDPKSKELFTVVYNAHIATNAATRADAEVYLAQAKAAADPYFKEQIRIAQETLSRELDYLPKDLKYTVTDLENRINDIKKDLSSNKEYLGLDETAQLNQQLREYESQLANTQDQMAQSGMAFSTKRTQAEDLLRETKNFKAESLSRDTAKKIRDMEQETARKERDYQNAIAQTQVESGRKAKSLIAETEAKIGTSALPSEATSAYFTPITGTYDYDKANAIRKLEDDIAARSNY